MAEKVDDAVKIYHCLHCGKFFHSYYKANGELVQIDAAPVEGAELLSCLPCYEQEMDELFPEDEPIPAGDFGY